MRTGADGFSLVELLVTIAVAGALMAFAIPSFTYSVANNRLTTAANDYVMALNEARLEAIRRNVATQVCGPSGNGTGDLATKCGTNSTGAVYAMPSNADDQPVLIRAAPTLSADVQVVSFQAVRYNAQGLGRSPSSTSPYAGRIVDLHSTRISSDSHRCVYMSTGTALKTCTTNANCDASTEPAACK